MKAKVYKSLDSPWSFLHLEGDYVLYGIAAMFGSGLIGAVVGSLVHRFLAMVLFLAFAGMAYGVVYFIQGSMSDKDLHKKIASVQRPKKIKARPVDHLTLMRTIKRP